MEPHSNEYRDQRLQNMQKLKELGHKPFGCAFTRTGRISEIRAGFEENRVVTIAGRLLTIRDMGKSIFADISDGSDRFQAYVQKNHIGDDSFAAFKLLDIGDHVGLTGSLFVTRMGEQTIKVDSWTLLSKALLPLPEKWHGLKDVEARYRERYLDLIANPEVKKAFDRRSLAIHEIRAFLRQRGFVEVETPMIQPEAGGADAKPFKTHYDALHADMFLRIAPELYLKRLLVGGFDRVFELNRCFRNEGLDRTHNPEFTILEIYEAYADVRVMQKLAEDLCAHVAQTVFGTLKAPGIQPGAEAIDLTPPWRVAAYADLIRERMGKDWYGTPPAEARKKAGELGLVIDPKWGLLEITHEIFEKVIQHTLIQPTFVTRLPASLVPLAKNCEDDPSAADVFELIIGGREIAPAYSELNDPIEQRRKLEAQAGADTGRIDEDFLRALEHGMPPAGGMGFGVDRLLMILSGSDAIRDVILFPQLKQKSHGPHDPKPE